MRVSAARAMTAVAALVALALLALNWGPQDHHAHAQGTTVTFEVNTTEDTPDANPGDGQCADADGNCSLRAAIMEANAQAGPSKEFVINLQAYTYSFSFSSRQSDTTDADADDLDVRAKITINGQGQEQTTLELSSDSYDCSRLFEVWEGAELTLQDMTIRGFCGFEDSDGGAVYVHRGATLTVHEVTFENNDSDDDGGAIYNEGTLTITNSTFARNDANDDGGAIYNVGTLTITGGVFDRNTADYGGGAINNDDDGTASIERSIFKGNFAGDYGGAIHNYGTLTVTETTFGGEYSWDGNHTPGDGGAIYISSGTATITASKFIRNRSSSGDGGAIDASAADSPVLVERSFFRLNRAQFQGGAIEGWVLVVNSTFVGNSAQEGGAIYGEEDAKVLFSTIADNTATTGGSYGGVTGVTIKNSIVARNSAPDGDENCDPWDIVAEGVNFTDDESCPGFIQVETDQLGLASTPEADGTLPLLPTSLALGAAVDCTDFSGAPVTTDQRGTSRPQGGACDAGAYELQDVSAPSLEASPGQVVEVGELEVFTGQETATFTVTYRGSDSVNITLAGPFNLGLFPRLVGAETTCNGATLSGDQSCTVTLTVSSTGLRRQGAAVRLEIEGAEPFYLLVYATGTITRIFHVNTTDDIAEDDSLLGDGRCDYDPDTADDQCSLRAALQEADAWDGGTFTIRLQPGLTYRPSTHLGKFSLWGYGSITIKGEGDGATIDGGVAPEDCTSPGWSPLLTLFAAGQLFKLQNVTIQHNCSTGPALLMRATGQLVLEGVTVQDNVGSGLGVWSNATVRISGSAFFRNKAVGGTWDGRYNKGGGIYIGPNPCCFGLVSPQVHIENTRFEGNEATLEGGALWVNISGGQVTVENSLFVGNRTGANGEGGAIWVSLPASEGGSQAGSMVIRNSAILDNHAGSDGGGGIYVGGPCDSGTLKLVNVTIAGNTTTGTGGGIDTSSCDRVHLSFVTITANEASQGGGIYSGGNGDLKRLKGVVLVGNRATQGSGPDCNGPITSHGGNVIGSTAGCTVTAQASDVTGVAANAVLAARDETTGTYPLAANSPAAGRVADCRDLDNTTVGRDQRGQLRPNPSNSACDAGAYESDQAGGGGGGTGGGGTGGQAPPPPPPSEETVPSPTGSGQVTFQVAGGATPSNLDVEPFTGTPPVLPSSLYQLPHGVYSLRVEGIAPGASVTIQVRLPSPAPVGTVWLKLIGGRWVALPVGSDDGDNVITVTLTDGGQGDADGVVNGVITDPGGPAIPLRIAALWGDVDCDGVAGVGDALKMLRHVVRLPVTARQPCPSIEERVLAAGALRAWGDVDGDGVVGAVDALKLLRHLVRLPVSRAPGTPSIGGEVEVSPPGE